MRDEVDLAKIINHPDKAREFINGIDWRPDKPPEIITLAGDDTIHLNNMSDYDAVRAAHFLLNNFEIPKILKDMQLNFPLH